MIRGGTRLAAVIGWPVEHSRSPQLLNAAFAAAEIDAAMVPIAAPPDDLPAVIAGLRAMRALGASVTVPHKLAAVALCDDLAPTARAIGAVNCIAFDPETHHAIGHNTDCDGFADALTEAGFSSRGARAVLLGAGGAARAVAHGLRNLRAIEVIARDPAAVTWARAWAWSRDQLAECFARADLVVDCTPVALHAGADEDAWVDALPLAALRPTATVASLVYHRAPRLLERARAAGHSTLDGRGMLVHQGARAFALWTGRAAPIAAMRSALDHALAAEP